jgi:predicted permease
VGSNWRMRLLALFRRDRIESEFDEELQYHLEREAERNSRRGMSRDDARAAAHRAIGNLGLIKDAARESWTWRWWGELWHDLGYAARTLRRAPAFTVVAVVSLGLAIGANTAIFGVLHAVLLDRVAVPNAEQLVAFWPEVGGARFPVSYAGLRTLAQPPGISRVEAFRAEQVVVTSLGARDYVWADLVSEGFFNMLGVRPMLGRAIGADDERTAAPVVLLSWEYWRRALAADSAVLGRTIAVNDAPFTIVGVMPRSYRGVYFGQAFSLAIPLAAAAAAGLPDVNSVPVHALMGRLLPGATAERAGAAVDLAFQHCCSVSQFPFMGRMTAASEPRGGNATSALHIRIEDASRGLRWATDLRGQYRRTLIGLMAGVLVLLLIACTNVGGLLLARAAARRREFAIRMSLGASPTRLVRQLLTESLQLALLGTMLGLALAYAMTVEISNNLPPVANAMTELIVLRPSGALLAVTVVTMVACTVVAGVFPAIRASRAGLITDSKESRGVVSSLRRWTADQALVVSQVALALVLVSGAILLAVTLRNLKGLDGGYKTTHVLLARIDTRHKIYEDRGLGPLSDPLLERLKTMPGVESAALASAAPVIENSGPTATAIHVRGYEPAPGERVRAKLDFVTPGYFVAAGIGLQSGRDFDRTDRSGGTPVAIIGAAMARRYLAGRDPIGASIVLGRGTPDSVLTIVGVANDARYEGLSAPPAEVFYVPLSQATALGWKDYPNDVILIVPTVLDPATLVPAVRAAINGVAPGIQIRTLAGIKQVLNEVLARERLAAALAMLFGVLALGLGAVGLYGVVTYNVERRTREIGIRMALGARPLDALRLVLKETVTMTTLGLAMGLPLALAASHAVRAELYGIDASDPRMLTGAGILLVAVGLLAGAVPAWRAGRVDPVDALRAE